MEIPEQQNKMVDGAQNKAVADQPKDVTVRAVSRMSNEYHFAGSGIWKPVSVIAGSVEDAIEQWKKVRQLIKPAETGNQS